MSCNRNFDKWSRKWDGYMRRHDSNWSQNDRPASPPEHWATWSKDFVSEVKYHWTRLSVSESSK